MKTYNAGTSYTAKRSYPKYDKNHKFSYLNQDLWNFWQENGYLKIDNVIPKDKCNKLVDQIWNYIEADSFSSNTLEAVERTSLKSIEIMKELLSN